MYCQEYQLYEIIKWKTKNTTEQFQNKIHKILDRDKFDTHLHKYMIAHFPVFVQTLK